MSWQFNPITFIYLFVRVHPSISASEVVKEYKGITYHELRRKYSNPLKKLPSMWTRSYFAATAGNVSQQTIRS